MTCRSNVASLPEIIVLNKPDGISFANGSDRLAAKEDEELDEDDLNKEGDILFGLTDVPPWYITVTLGLQV